MNQDQANNETTDAARLNAEEYCYLTTIGRVTGRPHEIEIWFGAAGRSIYFLSGGGDKSDWVRNLRREPRVKVRIGKATYEGTARVVADPQEESIARNLLADKYEEREEDGSLTEWGKTSLPVAIDLE